MTRYKKQKQSDFTVLTDGKEQGKARRKDGKNKKPGTSSPQGQKKSKNIKQKNPKEKIQIFAHIFPSNHLHISIFSPTFAPSFFGM